MSGFTIKNSIAIMFIILLYTIPVQAVNCISSEGLQQYLMSIAQNEADIANIPQYKAGMLIGKNSNLDNLKLIIAYKKTHLQDPLSEEQISQIKMMEITKQEFLRNNKCKN